MKTIINGLLYLLLLTPVLVIGQTTVKGKVTEQSSAAPLPGVNIVIKGTTTGTTTDFDGYYSIQVNTGDVLMFSYIGYENKEVTYTEGNTLDVQLIEDTSLLDEVVIIGYGSVKKEDLTGAVDLVSAKSFNKGAIVSADQLLTGKAPGVRITNAGGEPDATPNIRIRGGASLSANSNPLIVIDGIAIDNSNPAGVNNPLSLINPNDIESFTILKDASATAIYGSRASNGVIIITTKKGTSGEAQYSFSSNISSSRVSQQIDLFTGEEFTRFISSVFPNEIDLLGVPAGSVNTSESVIQTLNGRDLYNTDWQDAIYRTSFSTDNNFSVRASLFKKVPIRASVGYNSTEGVVKTNDYERFSASVKVTPTLLKDHLKIDFNAKALSVDKNTIDTKGVLEGAVFSDPTGPVFDRDSRFGGFFNRINPDPNQNGLDGSSNPLALLLQRRRPEQVNKILGNLELDYKLPFLPELRAVLNTGLEASRAKIREIFSENAIATYRVINDGADFVFNPGVHYRENQHITNTTLESYLVYNKQSDDFFIRNFEIQGGYGYQNFKNDGNKEQFRYDDATGLRIRDFQTDDRFFNELNLQSFFGRSNINILNKYLLTVSFRADASSLFREENRWGYFQSTAFAWKLKEENFLKDVDFINDFKIRLGWGKTGQQDITSISGFFPSIPLFERGSASAQYLEGIAIFNAKAFNEDLTWEKTTTINAGIDFSFTKNRLLTGAFDIFQSNTTDLLVNAPVGPGQGLSDVFPQNVGETESQGFELSLNLNPIQSDNWNLSINGNVAFNKTTVKNLNGITQITAPDSGIPTGTGVNLALHAVGEEAFSAWVFEQIYDANGSPVFGAFVDQNNDGVIDNDDRYLEPLRPNWTFGFGLDTSYKNWYFNASFRGQFDGKIYNARRLTSGFTEAALPNNKQSLTNTLDFFSGAADINFPNTNGNVAFSDYFLENAAFLRCESISLGYTFTTILKDANLKLYGAVNNAFIITSYTGQDPENFNAIDNNFYPRPRIYTLGMNLDF
jgi:iron complex outermembrane receptor protein